MPNDPTHAGLMQDSRQDGARRSQVLRSDAATESEVRRLPNTARAVSPSPSLGARVRELLARREHAEALALLYKVHEDRPHDGRISNAIQALKERMCIEYVEQLGKLDQVPTSMLAPGPRSLDDLSVDERIVLQLADGIVTYEDLLEISSLGRLRTLQALVRLLQRDVITAAPRGVLSPGASTLDQGLFDSIDRPDDAEACFHVAMRAYLARRFEEARDGFHRCLELNPNHTRALHNLEKVKDRCKPA